MIKEEIILKAINTIAETKKKKVKEVSFEEIIYLLADWNLNLATTLAYNQIKRASKEARTKAKKKI